MYKLTKYDKNVRIFLYNTHKEFLFVRKIIILLMTFIVSIGIMGCKAKGPQNLEEYYAISENRDALSARLNNENIEGGSIYTRIEFDAIDNLMIYKYTFASPVNTDSISKSIEVSLTDNVTNAKISELEEITGYSGISIQYIYYAPDNTEVFNKTFSKR